MCVHKGQYFICGLFKYTSTVLVFIFFADFKTRNICTVSEMFFYCCVSTSFYILLFINLISGILGRTVAMVLTHWVKSFVEKIFGIAIRCT